MFVKVHMLAFMEGTIRPVEIPPTTDLMPDRALSPIRALLETVFYYGQNDVQPVHRCCSVSTGDVAEHEGKFYLCCLVGWRELSGEEFLAYKAMDTRDRRFCKLVTENFSVIVA